MLRIEGDIILFVFIQIKPMNFTDRKMDNFIKYFTYKLRNLRDDISEILKHFYLAFEKIYSNSL